MPKLTPTVTADQIGTDFATMLGSGFRPQEPLKVGFPGDVDRMSNHILADEAGAFTHTAQRNPYQAFMPGTYRWHVYTWKGKWVLTAEAVFEVT